MKIEFICQDEATKKYFPPIPAKKLIPEWYKNLKNRNEEVYNKRLDAEFLSSSSDINSFTVKGCPPVLDYLTSGYIIRASADIVITPKENNLWWYSTDAENHTVGTHLYWQCPIKFNKDKRSYFKVTQQWITKTPPGYSCMFMQPFYNFEERFTLFPGIVDTDKYDVPVNFPGLILTNEPFKIEAGDPLMLVFPFKREEWSSEINVKPKSKSLLHSVIERGYKKFFHSPKSFD